jgi:hypothetical protein
MARPLFVECCYRKDCDRKTQTDRWMVLAIV